MRRAALASAFVALLAPIGAWAEIGTLDDVPAATLLLPYFEVDLDNPNGITTLFSVNNAEAGPAIAHVTLWTDLAVPTLDFNVFLTGYDVVTFNLRDLFVAGTVPRTSHNQTAVSPRGVYSLVTHPVSGVGPGSTSCNEQLPLPPLPATLLDHLRAAHTGHPSPVVFGGLKSGFLFCSDSIARGYLTLDNANFCSLRFPESCATGYFIAGGNGDANNLNQLWGDYFYVDGDQNFAQGETLVHLEASDALGADHYTFYRRFCANGEDQREGLGSTFAVRYVNGGAFTGGTDLLVWRDPKRPIAPFSPALPYPAPFLLGESQVVIFDEAENPDAPPSCPFSPPNCSSASGPNKAILAAAKAGLAANRVRVGGSPLTLVHGRAAGGQPPCSVPGFPVPFDAGWLYLDLNTVVAGSQVPFEPITQNFVSAVLSANGRFSVGYDAVQLDNVTYPAQALDVQLPVCDGAPDPPACQ
ncbi:MAG TPA: hypothetical protein PK413_06765, partial [Thermoanaerobaculia bacterium]|nr:hypothetical protein [Thermoanaerobaculia bacterium]